MLLAPDLVAEAEAIEAGSSRAARRDQQVQRILEAAKTCFLRSGFQGASMQHICAEAGMSPGALYRYFPSKEAIIEAIVEVDCRNDAEILSAITGSQDVAETVVNAALGYIHHIQESGNAPLFIEIRAEAMRNATVREAANSCKAVVAADFRERLGRAVEAGAIDPVVPLNALVQLMMAMADGVAMSGVAGREVSYEAARTAMYAMVESLLRPRRATAD